MIRRLRNADRFGAFVVIVATAAVLSLAAWIAASKWNLSPDGTAAVYLGVMIGFVSIAFPVALTAGSSVDKRLESIEDRLETIEGLLMRIADATEGKITHRHQ